RWTSRGRATRPSTRTTSAAPEPRFRRTGRAPAPTRRTTTVRITTPTTMVRITTPTTITAARTPARRTAPGRVPMVRTTWAQTTTRVRVRAPRDGARAGRTTEEREARTTSGSLQEQAPASRTSRLGSPAHSYPRHGGERAPGGPPGLQNR